MRIAETKNSRSHGYYASHGNTHGRSLLRLSISLLLERRSRCPSMRSMAVFTDELPKVVVRILSEATMACFCCFISSEDPQVSVW